MFGQGIQPEGGFFTLSTGFSTVCAGRGRVFPLVFHLFNGVFNTFLFQRLIRKVKSHSRRPGRQAARAPPPAEKTEAGRDVWIRFLIHRNLSDLRVFRCGIAFSLLFNIQGAKAPSFLLWKTFPVFHSGSSVRLTGARQFLVKL